MDYNTNACTSASIPWEEDAVLKNPNINYEICTTPVNKHCKKRSLIGRVIEISRNARVTGDAYLNYKKENKPAKNPQTRRKSLL